MTLTGRICVSLALCAFNTFTCELPAHQKAYSMRNDINGRICVSLALCAFNTFTCELPAHQKAYSMRNDINGENLCFTCIMCF